MPFTSDTDDIVFCVFQHHRWTQVIFFKTPLKLFDTTVIFEVQPWRTKLHKNIGLKVLHYYITVQKNYLILSVLWLFPASCILKKLMPIWLHVASTCTRLYNYTCMLLPLMSFTASYQNIYVYQVVFPLFLMETYS